MPSKSFQVAAAAADTKTLVGAAYTVPKSGVVRRIRVCGYNAVATKAGTGILRIESDRQTGMMAEYAIQLGGGAVDTMGQMNEILSPALSLEQGEIISVYVTMTEACTEVAASIEWA